MYISPLLKYIAFPPLTPPSHSSTLEKVVYYPAFVFSYLIMRKISNCLSGLFFLSSLKMRFGLFAITCYQSYRLAKMAARIAHNYLRKDTSIPNPDPKKIVSHDYGLWNRKFSKATPSEQRQLYAEIFQQTKLAAVHGWFVGGSFWNLLSSQKEVHLDPKTTEEMQSKTEFVESKNTTPSSSSKEASSAEKSIVIDTVSQDSIDEGLKLLNQSLNPAILNMAHMDSPGGDVEKGSQNQEAEIFRRSNYFQALYPECNPTLKKLMSLEKIYEIPENKMIYTPHVQIFRASREEGYRFYSVDEVRRLSFIAFPAYSSKTQNFVNSIKKEFQQKTYLEKLKEKIRAIFRTAYIQKHDSLVIGAWGCAVSRNDPNEMKETYASVLKEEEFKEKFKKISFATVE